MNLPRPRSAQTFVKAEVSVVLPWSTCPIVPMFTCGLRRSYFAFAITSPYLPVQSVKYLRYCISAAFDRFTRCNQEQRVPGSSKLDVEPTTRIDRVTSSLQNTCSAN